MQNTIASLIHQAAKRVIAVPLPQPAQTLQQKKPAELFADVTPLLREMGITPALFQQQYTQVEPTKLKKDNVLYWLFVDREKLITPDVIARLNRHKENVEGLLWSSRSMILKLWYPQTPATPLAPGAH